VFTSYEEALHYLYTSLPVFQRDGASAYKPDLTNTLKLCEALGNPQRQFKSIHVAGTNGKGSTSHMLASILQSAGYKTGLYTSPHLKNFTERIRVNGGEVSRAFVIDFINRIHSAIDDIKPSFFEITVAMAFDYYALQKVDVAVVEVGLGGRLDSTNVITPLLSVITNIGWDHTDLLGNTLPAIAFEKAGIIKREVPVVISENQPAVKQVFMDKAQLEDAPIYFASDVYRSETNLADGQMTLEVWRGDKSFINNLVLPLQGFYQRKNINGVLQAVQLLNDLGMVISHNHLVEGLHNVVQNTHLKGRWQKLGEYPLVICDTGHNADGMQELVSQIKAQHYSTLHIVLGMVKDKDITSVLQLLPAEASYYFCQARIPRAMEADVLARKANSFGLYGIVIQNVNDAISHARKLATPDDFIFIGGSTFVVAEIDDL
jgi:dihydrofolate synthase/folylpolyglutamate synthase